MGVVMMEGCNYGGQLQVQYHSRNPKVKVKVKAAATAARRGFKIAAAAGRRDDDESKSSPEDDIDGAKQVPAALKLAMEKARMYKTTNKGKVQQQQEVQTSPSGGGNKKLTVSSMDFVGLNFGHKRAGSSRTLPPGLAPPPTTTADMPEVELILGDTTNFGNPPPPSDSHDDHLYKPKVSTWGVFPRPTNISKTFGGGRVIRPGEVLETAEDKAAKEVRTRQLLAAYKKKMGYTIDPKLKSECEKDLKRGDYLMDVGKLKEALPYYEKVMNELGFQSELHGLAALQWSICQDSLSSSDEAKVMYGKLQSHPNPRVSKKARQFMFGFQAIEMMKVKTSVPITTDYENYFEAFVENKRDYLVRVGEDKVGAISETLAYILFLVSPIFLVLCIAAWKAI